MLKITVEAKVKIDFEDPLKTQVIVRKVVRSEGGEFVLRYGLSSTGRWVMVPEGERYPDECYLPVLVYDNWSEHGLVSGWVAD